MYVVIYVYIATASLHKLPDEERNGVFELLLGWGRAWASVRLRARLSSGDAHAHDGTGTERSNRGSVTRAKVEELFVRTVSCHEATG